MRECLFVGGEDVRRRREDKRWILALLEPGRRTKGIINVPQQEHGQLSKLAAEQGGFQDFPR